MARKNTNYNLLRSGRLVPTTDGKVERVPDSGPIQLGPNICIDGFGSGQVLTIKRFDSTVKISEVQKPEGHLPEPESPEPKV